MSKLAESAAWRKELAANFWELQPRTGRALQDFLAAEYKEHKEILGEIGLAK
ncbi:hypothetical protein D3C83_187990 [compost metagenome]